MAARAKRLVAAASGWVSRRFLGLLLVVVALSLVLPQAGLALRNIKFFQIPFTTWTYDFPTLTLQLLMLSASIHSDIRDFRHLIERPRAMWVSLFVIYAMVPLIAIAAAVAGMYLVPGGTALQLQLGLMFLALMPVAKTSALWVRINDGNVPLLLAIVTVNSALAVVTIPSITAILPGVSGGAHPVPIDSLVRQLVMSVTVPLILGVALRRVARSFVERWEAAFALVGTVALFFSVGTNVAAATPLIVAEGTLVVASAVVAVALNVAYLWIPMFLARRLNLAQEDSIAVVFCGGLRSMGTALGVAPAAFPTMPLVVVPAAVYCISQQILAGYVTRTLRASEGGHLGLPIGADEDVLAAHLERVAPAASPPGLAVIGFRFAGARPTRIVTALSRVVPRVRRILRGDDVVCFVPPNGFGVVLERTGRAGAAIIAAKVTAVVAEIEPGLRLDHTIAHSEGPTTSDALIESAFAAPRADPLSRDSGGGTGRGSLEFKTARR